MCKEEKGTICNSDEPIGSGDPVVKTALQHKEHQLDPWCGKIPHATEQLSPVRSN